jgi:hypothetical protein
MLGDEVQPAEWWGREPKCFSNILDGEYFLERIHKIVPHINYH